MARRPAPPLHQQLPGAALGHRRVVFNLKGNDHRVIVSVRHADEARGFNGIVRVHFVGTHAEYDRIDAETVDLRPNGS